MAVTYYKFHFSYNKYRNGKLFGCGIKIHEQRCGILDQEDIDNVIDELQDEYRNVGVIIADAKLTP